MQYTVIVYIQQIQEDFMKKRFIGLVIALLMVISVSMTLYAEGQQDGSSNSKAPTVTWKLSHTQDPKSTYHQGAEKMKEYVEEKTNGRFTINIFHSSQLGWEREVLEAMQIGTVEATIPALGPFATFVDSYNVFNLPFTFQGPEHMLRAYEHPVMNELIKDAEKQGFIVATHCLPTFRYPLYNKRPILEPDDFKGLKIRTMSVPAHVDTYKALGAQVVTTAFNEVYSALQMGAIDGNENYYQNLYTMKFHEQSEYISNLPILNNAAAFVFSKAAWDKLPADYQQILIEGAKLGAEIMNDVAIQQEEEALEAMVAYGVEKVFIDDFTPFIEATQEVSDKYLSEMEPWVADVRTAIMSLAK